MNFFFVQTDENGFLTIDVTEDGVVAVTFAGNDEFAASETSINFASTVTKTTPTITINYTIF